MDLAAVLSRYPSIGLAEPNDNQSILKFFNNLEMEGKGFKLRYERSPDFFSFLNARGPLNHVFLGYGKTARTSASEEASKVLKGSGTFSIRKGYVRGKIASVGYLGDLRTSFDRHLTREWKMFYTDILKSSPGIPELGNCKYFLTAIINDNENARRSLIRDRSEFRYIKICDYRMVNLLARMPRLAFRKPQGIQCRQAKPNDLENLIQFLESCSQLKPFGFVWSEELPWRLKNWPGFSLENFLLVFKDDHLVACCAPWNPGPLKRMFVDGLPSSMKLLALGLKMVKGAEIREGHVLKVNYLTALNFSEKLSLKESKEVLHQLLDTFWRSKFFDPKAFTAICDYDSKPVARKLRGYLGYEIPMSLYQVLHKDHLKDHRVPDDHEPDFEMALV